MPADSGGDLLRTNLCGVVFLMCGMEGFIRAGKTKRVWFFIKIAGVILICDNSGTNINCNNSLILPV